MYLREPGDSGFSSRDPAYDGAEDAVTSYRLANGQVDDYPTSWSLPQNDLLAAIEYFVETLEMAPSIAWHEN